MIWENPWAWAAFAVVMAVAEVILPGFILLGFAGGAVVTAVLVGVGLLGGSLAATLLVFALASLASWLVIRRVFPDRRGSVTRFDRDINDN